MAREDRGGLGFLTFLVGAAVGAGLGLLFAPKTGKETREKLADWLNQRRELGEGLLSKFRDVVPEKKEQIAAAARAAKSAYVEAGKHNHVEQPQPVSS